MISTAAVRELTATTVRRDGPTDRYHTLFIGPYDR
ncbi:hypothetical protein HALLA_02540 (plasmid) [Halostagnicola larsenii XH-48]|uniref:Uncharacterized protein n=1 Tax=Halostagnicola larsenii XH-48 TaxID=797299 RepID=W0JRF3_9EURY|nr:hypothetical protein HALLA_02540 [Halostagnicola larsenii XH-48]